MTPDFFVKTIFKLSFNNIMLIFILKHDIVEWQFKTMKNKKDWKILKSFQKKKKFQLASKDNLRNYDTI